VTVAVPILEQGPLLIAAMPEDPTDRELDAFQRELSERIGHRGATGVVIDVSAMMVLDSFATRMLETLAHVAALRGARAVVVGIQPDVALAMVQLGVTLGSVDTARDLEDAMQHLHQDAHDGA
jgi:rsbT antagonist protein RsbS